MVNITDSGRRECKIKLWKKTMNCGTLCLMVFMFLQKNVKEGDLTRVVPTSIKEYDESIIKKIEETLQRKKGYWFVE